MGFASDKIRNIMLAGHNNSGKTTLAEALLFAAKTSDRHGKVEDGNTVMDFDPEETKRGVSLASAVASLEFDGVKTNLIDVPGLFDFELGMYEGIAAVESVLITVSARSGVTVGTHKAYDLAVKNGKSRMIFVSKIDTDHADFYKVFEQLKVEFGTSVCPIVVPFIDGDKRIYISLIENKAYEYIDGKPTVVEIPDMGHRLAGLIEAMTEAVAETDDVLMEKFFEGVAFSQEEMLEGVRLGVKTGAITPVLCGVPTSMEAIDLATKYMKKLLPSAHRGCVTKAVSANGEEIIECEEKGPLAAYVFKTVADPFVGKLSYVKILRGILKPDSPVANGRTKEAEKLGKLVFMQGKKQVDTGEISAGDIGVVTKMTNVKTGDVLCAPSNILTVEGSKFPNSPYKMAMQISQKGGESKLAGAMQRLLEEDVTLTYNIDKETLQQLVGGLGEQHIEFIVAKLKSKFGVEVGLEVPRVAYRETIRKKVKAQGRHKKQTGGHGQFGDVIIEFEPIESDELVFEEKVFGGSVPKNFFPAVEKGLREAVGQGVVAGYPVVGVKATLLDGSYHPVDSSEMAFRLAARLAYRKALPETSPAILEPIGSLKAYVPEANTGDILGETSKRRGRIIGMTPDADGLQCVEAEIPMSEMHDFTTYMRQLTQGRGHYSFEFARYELLPMPLEAGVVEAAKLLFDLRGDEE